MGDLFPETFPFNYSRIFDYHYFFIKYYMSQRNLLAIPKRPLYVNYEVLSNAFATKIIDFSKAEIYKLKTTQTDKKVFEKYLES